MFPISRRKVMNILKSLGVNYRYFNTKEFNFNEDSALELFVIYSKSKSGIDS